MEALKDIASTTVGSAACVIVGQPFDTIKVRLQVLSAEYGTSSISCIRKTIAGEGLAALWRGYMPAFAGAVTENATAFVLNGVFHRLLGEEEGAAHSRSPGKSFVLGAAAGFFTAFVLCPSDVVKCREQVFRCQGKARAARHIAADLYKSAGWRGFTLGLGPQIARDVAFFAFFFGSYDFFTAQLQTHTALPTSVTYFVAGGFAGQMAWLASLPMDMVKSVVQTSPDTGLSALAVTRQVCRSGGVPTFYRGTGVTMLRAFPSNAALFLGYELSKSILGSNS